MRRLNEVTGTANVVPHPTASACDHMQSSSSPMSLVELDTALDELEAIGAGIPANNERITHPREDIYCDHD